MAETVGAEYFGTCPVCDKAGPILNLGRDHWGTCQAHKRKWLIGSNLFSGWKEQTDAEFWLTAAILSGYRGDESEWPFKWRGSPANDNG